MGIDSVKIGRGQHDSVAGAEGSARGGRFRSGHLAGEGREPLFGALSAVTLLESEFADHAAGNHGDEAQNEQESVDVGGSHGPILPCQKS